MFNAWGRFVHRFRWLVLAVSTLCLGISIVGLFTGGQFSQGNSDDTQLQAARANQLVAREITKNQNALESAVTPLIGDSRVVKVTTPYNQGVPLLTNFVSKDQHMALVHVELKDPGPTARHYIDQVTGEVKSSTLAITVTGNVP